MTIQEFLNKLQLKLENKEIDPNLDLYIFDDDNNNFCLNLIGEIEKIYVYEHQDQWRWLSEEDYISLSQNWSDDEKSKWELFGARII